MKNFRVLALTSVLACFASAANADILVLPTGGYGVTQGAGSVQRGASQAEVLQHLGEPQKRHSAVGVPAISSWDYPEFRVYFENGVVLHTVFSAP
jgi:hypothetical protein